MAVPTSWGAGGSPSLLPSGVSNVPPLARQPGLLGEGERLSQIKSFPCPHSKGSASSEDGARMGRGWSEAGAKLERGSAPSALLPPGERLSRRIPPHHPSPTHSAASPPALCFPQAGAFNYSCPPLQTACARWAGAIAFQTGASWEAPAAFPACRLRSRSRAGRAVR